MSWILEAASLLALGVGLALFAVGTVGVLRFADLLSRVHAVTKADNVGLGLVVLALALQAGSAAEVVRLLAIWLIALVASAAACQLIAREAATTTDGPATDSEPETGG